MIFFKQWSLAMIAGTAGGMLAGPASAALTQLDISQATTYSGVVYGGGVSGHSIILSGLSTQRVGGDPLPFSTTGPFTTFCLDIRWNLITTDLWQTEPGAKAGTEADAVHFVSGGLQRAISLYDGYAGSVDNSTTTGRMEGAALQLAIWNVLFDTDTSVVSGGGFKVTGANKQVTQLANEMLLSPYNAINLTATASFWNGTDFDNCGDIICDQDLIGPPLPSGPVPGVSIPGALVPEPGTFAAAASALGYLGFMGIRVRRKRG